uniref:Secreted venom protein family 3 protein n=1 Tax=Pristhesancus plagipennis TaxID=1955184 RepID=A0A2K8JSN6_PRIPG|nr:secreted venom protein family 3 protein [Pristhesancus plagipennis]
MDTKLVLLLVLGIVATAWAYSKSSYGSGATHDLIMGIRQPGDKLLDKIRSTVIEGRESNVQWPLKGKSQKKITLIEVLDQKHDGSGGYATLVGGGIGSNYFKLRLKAQKRGSSDFLIKIYGK